MPLDGGAPMRRTFDGGPADGRRLDARRQGALRDATATRRCPTRSCSTVDPDDAARTELVPLAQASDGAYAADGDAVLHAPAVPGQPHQALPGRHGAEALVVRRGAAEAAPLTADYPGTSKAPMVWQGPRLLPQRPRRHDEPLVDDARGRRLGSTRATPAWTCSRRRSPRPHRLPARRRPPHLRHRERTPTRPCRSGWSPTSTRRASAG